MSEILENMPDVPHWLNWLVVIIALLSVIGIPFSRFRELFGRLRDWVAFRNHHWTLRRIAEIKRRRALRREALSDPIKMSIYVAWVILGSIVSATMIVIFTSATVAIIVLTSFSPPTGLTSLLVLLLQVACMTALCLGIMVQGSLISRHTDLRNPKASDERDGKRLAELEKRATDFLLS